VKGHIQKVLFKGNQRIKSSELKKLMATKEKKSFPSSPKKAFSMKISLKMIANS